MSIKKVQDIYIYDISNNKYIDTRFGAGTFILGHTKKFNEFTMIPTSFSSLIRLQYLFPILSFIPAFSRNRNRKITRFRRIAPAGGDPETTRIRAP